MFGLNVGFVKSYLVPAIVVVFPKSSMSRSRGKPLRWIGCPLVAVMYAFW